MVYTTTCFKFNGALRGKCGGFFKGLIVLQGLKIPFKALAGFKQAKAYRLINIDFFNGNFTTIKPLSNYLKINAKLFPLSIHLSNVHLKGAVSALDKKNHNFIIPAKNYKNENP